MSALRKVAGTLRVPWLVGPCMRAASVGRARWFVPCLGFIALAAINLPVFLTSLRVSTHPGGSKLTSATANRSTNRGVGSPGLVGSEAETPSAPQLEFSTERLDLGDGKPNEILRGDLALFNRGAETARFALVKHCGCTELSPLSGELAPGASQTIHVGMQLANHANSEKSTSIEIQVGEQAAIVGRCTVAARCPAPFHVEPAYINLGSVGPDEIACASAEIHVSPVVGQPPFDVEAMTISHSDAAFKVETVKMPGRDNAAVQRVAFRVTLASGLPPGDHWDTLELRLRGTEYSMRVPLNATVVLPVTVVPASITLCRVPGMLKYKSVRLLVIDRRHGGGGTPVTILQGPPGIIIENVGDASNGRRCLRVSADDRAERWSDESHVRLDVGGATLTFKIHKQS